MRNGYRRGESFEGKCASRGSPHASGPSGPEDERLKRDEPRTGSGAQQTRNARAEKAVRAVRNREGGTRRVPWQGLAEGKAATPSREWTLVHQSVERRSGRIPGEEDPQVRHGARALEERQAWGGCDIRTARGG